MMASLNSKMQFTQKALRSWFFRLQFQNREKNTIWACETDFSFFLFGLLALQDPCGPHVAREEALSESTLQGIAGKHGSAVGTL